MGQVAEAEPDGHRVECSSGKTQILGVALDENDRSPVGPPAGPVSSNLHHGPAEIIDHDLAAGTGRPGGKPGQACRPPAGVEDEVPFPDAHQADRLFPPPGIEPETQDRIGKVVGPGDFIELVPDEAFFFGRSDLPVPEGDFFFGQRISRPQSPRSGAYPFPLPFYLFFLGGGGACCVRTCCVSRWCRSFICCFSAWCCFWTWEICLW